LKRAVRRVKNETKVKWRLETIDHTCRGVPPLYGCITGSDVYRRRMKQRYTRGNDITIERAFVEGNEDGELSLHEACSLTE
jgi:hypothetical protein